MNPSDPEDIRAAEADDRRMRERRVNALVVLVLLFALGLIGMAVLR